MKSWFFHALVLAFASLLYSCSNTRYLAEGQNLYKGAEVKIADSNLSKKIKNPIQDELATYIRPRENRKVLGLKFKLWVWNFTGGEKAKKGLNLWLRNKVGEPPVLDNEMRLENNNLMLEAQMFNKGFFNATSLGEKITKNKRTKAVFSIEAGPRYFYKNIDYLPKDTSHLASIIRQEQKNSLIKTGDPYDFNTLVAEKERLGKILTNQGFYFFNSDYLLFLVDTAIDTPCAINLRLKIKEETIPPGAYDAFRINNIVILPSYRMPTGNSKYARKPSPADTSYYEHFTVVERKKTVKKIVFTESIQFEKGELFSEIEQNKTLSRLVGTDLFKFVKSDFEVVRDSSTYKGNFADFTYNSLLQRGLVRSPNPQLNVYYKLTQYPKKKISVDVGAYSLNDSRLGSRLNVNWKHRNLLKGAEHFAAKALAGFEVQFGGGENKRPNTYNLGAEVSYTVPRFSVPFFNIKSSTTFLPKTSLTARYDYYLRMRMYRINSATLAFGYAWKETATKEHKINPINLTYVKADTFASIKDFQLQNILFNGIIIGPTYEFTYNSQIGAKKKNEYYLNTLVDVSGNIIGWIQGADFTKGEKTIFNNVYAQYFKVQADFRYYHTISKKQNLATRIYAGYGHPYGNSSILPNVKQLFSGGISSVRGFSSRMIGPGTFNEKYVYGTNTYIEMLGDIKLEGNIEYRRQLYDFVHGAVFVDAGNVWLKNSNPKFPGGAFSAQFLNQLAVGAGLGLRLDFGVIMIRGDLGFPIRKPWLPAGNRWTFNQIDFGSKSWRKENIVFGFAIGYPF